MRSRYGSHALAWGARVGGGGHGAGEESVDTSPEMAGFSFPFSCSLAPANRSTGCLQIVADGLTTNARLPFNPAKRPPQTAERDDLLSSMCVQDVSHRRRRSTNPSSRSTSRPTVSERGRFEVSINGPFWVSTEGKAAWMELGFTVCVRDLCICTSLFREILLAWSATLVHIHS